MERMRSIPVDLILHELAARLAELPDTQHRDLHRAISRGCIRPQFLADEWTSGAGVAQQAAWLVRRLDGEDMTTPRLREIAAETRAMEVAVARRLADCALSLLVTQDPEDAAIAQTLLQAAQRVVGLATAKPSAEADRLTSATDSAEDGLSPVTLRHYLAATRDALGLGSGPVFLSDIVARAKSLAETAASEGVNKASIAAAIEREDAWLLWATKLAGQGHEHSSPKALREALSACFIDSKGQRLKVARDCLPPNVDIIVCMRGNDPTTYKAANTDEEHDTPEDAVRAAWTKHIANRSGVMAVPSGSIVFDSIMLPSTGSISPAVKPRAFKVGDRVKFIGHTGGRMFQHGPVVGGEGTVNDIEESGACPIWVGDVQCKNGGSDGWWFSSAELVHVTPTA